MWLVLSAAVHGRWPKTSCTPRKNVLPDIHVHSGRFRIREEFGAWNLEHLQMSADRCSDSQSRQQHQVQGLMKSPVKFYHPEHPNSCKRPIQTDHMVWRQLEGIQGSGQVRASSCMENMKFIVGWGGGNKKALWKALKAQPAQFWRQCRQSPQKQKVWWRNPCGKGWDTELLWLPRICCWVVVWVFPKKKWETHLPATGIHFPKEGAWGSED